MQLGCVGNAGRRKAAKFRGTEKEEGNSDMEEQVKSVIPDRYKILSGSALKCIALFTMIIDHVGRQLLAGSNIVLLRIAQKTITLDYLMTSIGRLAFPIYCFLLVEGFLHTHDRIKYGGNLLLFALISEIPWNLEHTGTWMYAKQNVFFTLFLGYLGLYCVEGLREKPRYQLAALLVLTLTATYLKADYGVIGFGFVLLLYCLRSHKILQAVLGCCFLSSRWVGGLAFIPINLYNGKRGFIRGRFLKYAFYAAYPLHIFIIYLIKKNTVGF